MSAQPNLFQPKARARREDPDTSKAAAESVDSVPSKRMAVLKMFDHALLTDEQLVDIYNMNAGGSECPRQSPSGIRTRRSELSRLGYLKDSGERRKTMSGRWAIVWMKA